MHQDFIKRLFPIHLALLACLFSGCFLLTPEDPPLETQTLYPDDFSWDKLDLRLNPTYYPDKPADCATIQSILTSSGKCLPTTLPFGAAVECPLAYPASSLVYACITSDKDKIPAIYVRMKWLDNAKNIVLPDKFGTCHLVQAGPLAGEEARYPTDNGYKACLFEPNPNADELNFKAAALLSEDHAGLVQSPQNNAQSHTFIIGTNAYNKTRGQLAGSEKNERPAGLFLDFANNANDAESIENELKLNIFDAPAELVLDTRLLDQSEREQAIKDVIVLFDFYRNQEIVPEMNGTP